MEMAKKWTAEEFDLLEPEPNDTQKYELLNGVILMSPSPTATHQFVSSNLQACLYACFRNTSCQAACELDIKIDEQNVLKPDVMVFCADQPKMPKIVVEILSPSTKRYDLMVKPEKYRSVEGILEYWIVDPKEKSVIVYDFASDLLTEYHEGEIVRSKNIPEIMISVSELFTFKITPYN